ncbi:SDR family oxidoreductase [Pacificimonas flava]|uniref:SDR family oxidoreductase n=1 Tax=Pacificimonas flava TaxID=1234595 RepID=UPI00056E58D7|nr:SDR family oxidoreductase [Pacificimonas flava]MBB5280085.1 NAD(P)-dependent dehydrogenase (short-subunit alcohol dehydrogenase family) [Pacificimonas flava]
MPKCLIVGASRGIGREFVAQYLADGWEVHATARKESDCAELRDSGASAYLADVADEDALSRLAGDLPGDFDLIVHNAGVGTQEREGPIDDVDPADWERVMRINALGPILSARRLKGKLKAPGGTFAVLSSLMGSIGDNGFGGYWTYRMSKAAANMAVKNMAIAFLEDGIGVVALHPGHVQTDMGGSGAPVKPADSVSGMRSVIRDVRPGQDALFRDYQGKSLSW